MSHNNMHLITELHQAAIELPGLQIQNTCLDFEQAICHADDLDKLVTRKKIESIREWSRKKFIAIGNPLDLTYSGWVDSFEVYFKLESALEKLEQFTYFELDSLSEQNCLILIPLHVTQRTTDSYFLDWADKWIYIAPSRPEGRPKDKKVLPGNRQ